jgi:hypothetical protein
MRHLRLVANLCLRDATASKSESSVYLLINACHRA